MFPCNQKIQLITMKYVIHHLDSIEPAGQQKLFEEEVVKKLMRLEKFLMLYPHPLKLHVHIKKEGSNYIIVATLPMQARILMSREKGSQPLVLLHAAVERLRKQAKEQIHTERRDYLFKRRERQSYINRSGMEDLHTIKQDNDPDYFIFYLKRLLPGLNQYINISAAKMQALKPLFKHNKIRIYDLRHEIYVRLYKQFEKPDNSSEKLHIWVIRTTDQILEQLAKKYQYRFLKETDYSENGKHAGAIVNPLFIDAQEELLEEQFFNPRHYNPGEILYDAGADDYTIEKAEDGQYDHQLIKWLQELDSWHTSLFFLCYQMRLNTAEIARIKQKSETEIKNTLHDLRTSLLGYFQ